MTLSHTLWGLDWSRHFPLALGGSGLAIELAAFADVAAFAARHFERIFGLDAAPSPFLWQTTSAARARYYELCADCFAITAAGRTVGVSISTPLDWSTYYFRTIGILPEHAAGGAATALLSRQIAALHAAGVERLEADTSPSNAAMLRVFHKLGFVNTGYRATERWGCLVTMTRFLDATNASVFAQRLCFGGAAVVADAGSPLAQKGDRHEKALRPDHVLSGREPPLAAPDVRPS